ncbi:MAG TPA: hypothetical protein VK116_12955, partial [Planctomycetota bacterium]|nr:hypothetical protein [Planctomycetota bacterium]
FVPVTVMKESQRSETKVHGNVSGDGATQYAGGRVHGTITSTVTRYQEICVQSADGDETVIELVNEKLPCREGHDIAIVQLRRVGGSFDTVAFHNENTGETLFRDRAARDAIRGYPKRLPVFLLLFSSFVAGLVFTAGDAPSPGVMAKSGALPGLIFFVILMVIQEGLIRFRASLRLPGIGRALRAKLEARRAG